MVPELQMLLLRTLEQYVHEGMEDETMPISCSMVVIPVVFPCEIASEPIESCVCCFDERWHSSLSGTVLKKGL